MTGLALLRSAANDNRLELEYDCRDCGVGVLCCVPMPCATERRCLTCSFIAFLPEPHRTAARKRIGRYGLMPEDIDQRGIKDGSPHA